MAQLLTGQTNEYCNVCICENGTSRCTNLWCGLPNCFKTSGNSKSSNFSGVCKQHEVCVPTLSENCLNGPCPLRGDCRSLEPSHRVAPPRLPAKPDCWPNQASLNDNCARLTILLDRQRVGIGSSVEGLCSVLRFLLASRMITIPKAENEGMLIVICDLKTGTNDTIEVTVVSKNFFVFASETEIKNFVVFLFFFSPLHNQMIHNCQLPYACWENCCPHAN